MINTVLLGNIPFTIILFFDIANSRISDSRVIFSSKYLTRQVFKSKELKDLTR